MSLSCSSFVRVGAAALAVALGSCAQALDVRVLVASGAQVSVRLLGTEAQPQVSPQTWTVGLGGSKLTLNGKASGSDTLYVPPAPGSLVQVGAKTYRGGVLLRVSGGKVQAINVVNVEDYLRGVVPAEMPALWPKDALKAQAVVARTYVSKRVNPAAPFDICATENCQVYPGVRGEHEGSDAAIRETLGEVITYRGEMADTYFSANSGGYTASAAEVWGKNLPYLPAKADPKSLEAAGDKADWARSVAHGRVQSAAAQYRLKVGTVTRVQFSRVSASGRVEEIAVSGSGGSARLKGADAGGFVRALGAPSSRARVDGSGAVSASQPLRLRGQGSGHGVGLSQYGALGFARAGTDHRRVLEFYYPGTQIRVLGGASATAQHSLREPAAAASAVAAVFAAPTAPVPAADLASTDLASTDLASTDTAPASVAEVAAKSGGTP